MATSIVEHEVGTEALLSSTDNEIIAKTVTVTLPSSMNTDSPQQRKSKLSVPSGGSDAPHILESSGHNANQRKNSSISNTATNSYHAATAASSSKAVMQVDFAQYVQRLLDVRQMDVQAALDQMKTLVSTRPHVVYKTSYYRKQTKNHWYRDDPAFVALQGVFLTIACVAYAVAFRVPALSAILFILTHVLWNWLGLGVVIATLCRELSNRHLLTQSQSNAHVRQQVEWLYAFDIHCNAFFPVFCILYGLQFFLLPIVLGDGFVALLVANTLYLVALSAYWYITHLGYRTLPFLSQTEVFLFPVAALVVVYIVMLVGHPLGFGWNAARVMARFYFM